MSSFTGVHERDGSFQAKITVDEEQIYLGDWPTEEKAAAAYDSAAQYYREESTGPNNTEAPPRSKEDLQRLAHQARSKERGDTSKYRGVRKETDRSGWVAQIWFDNWSHFLGRYAQEEEAARAFDAAVRQYRPGEPTNFNGTEALTVSELRQRAKHQGSENKEDQ